MRATLSIQTVKAGNRSTVMEPTTSSVILNNSRGSMTWSKLKKEIQKVMDRVEISKDFRVERVEIQIQSGPRGVSK